MSRACPLCLDSSLRAQNRWSVNWPTWSQQLPHSLAQFPTRNVKSVRAWSMAQSPSTVCVLTGCGSQSVGPLAHLTLDPQGKSPGRPDPDPGPALQPHHRDFILGRSLNADVLIRDVQISRQHALIQVRWGGPGPDQWWLQDPGSINGVFLNGRPIPVQSFVPLQHGHRLSLEPKHGYQWQVHLRPAPPLPLDPASAPPMSRSTPAAHRLPSPSRDGPAAKRARLAGRGPASPTTRPARAHGGSNAASSFKLP
eukprot:TCALIF_05001-PA protein Name:"Protein of unknown function" AED:0.02 eAED:0.02 QI:100/1/0.5/1/1/1/2/0/252